jgi:hypothetical protein
MPKGPKLNMKMPKIKVPSIPKNVKHIFGLALTELQGCFENEDPSWVWVEWTTGKGSSKKTIRSEHILYYPYVHFEEYVLVHVCLKCHFCLSV